MSLEIVSCCICLGKLYGRPTYQIFHLLPLRFPVFLQLGKVKHLFLTSEVEVTLTRAASGPRHENPHEILQSSLLPAMVTEAA